MRRFLDLLSSCLPGVAGVGSPPCGSSAFPRRTSPSAGGERAPREALRCGLCGYLCGLVLQITKFKQATLFECCGRLLYCFEHEEMPRQVADFRARFEGKKPVVLTGAFDAFGAVTGSCLPGPPLVAWCRATGVSQCSRCQEAPRECLICIILR